MIRTTASRPRMAAIYAPGRVRAGHWHGAGDVRGYRPPSGWSACADLTDIPPITGRALRVPCGGSSRRRNNRDQQPNQKVAAIAGGAPAALKRPLVGSYSALQALYMVQQWTPEGEIDEDCRNFERP